MWVTLLVMAVVISLEPLRVGLAALMLDRARPPRHLLAFLCGGLAMGSAVGAVVLFALRPVLLGSKQLALPKVQLVTGVLALLVAAVMASGVRLHRRRRPDEHPSRFRRLVTSDSPWLAAAAGLCIALPSVDSLAPLAVILASGVSATAALTALLLFQVVAFLPVEIPLLAYLVAPRRTREAVDAVQRWLRARRRREVAALVAVLGTVLVVAGWTSG